MTTLYQGPWTQHGYFDLAKGVCPDWTYRGTTVVSIQGRWRMDDRLKRAIRHYDVRIVGLSSPFFSGPSLTIAKAKAQRYLAETRKV